jgi:hypothetical protein
LHWEDVNYFVPATKDTTTAAKINSRLQSTDLSQSMNLSSSRQTEEIVMYSNPDNGLPIPRIE